MVVRLSLESSGSRVLILSFAVFAGVLLGCCVCLLGCLSFSKVSFREF